MGFFSLSAFNWLISRNTEGNSRKAGKLDDVLLKDPRDSDLVVAIIGSPGSGKSTFINTLFGDEVASVGHGLISHTVKIQPYLSFDDPNIPDRRVVVIDTPGFDDTSVSDREVLRRIAAWLARSYETNRKLAGLIYLQDISHNRLHDTRRHFTAFEGLCGLGGARKVVLVTTMWSRVGEEAGQQRENELRDEYWQDMLDQGSTVLRFHDTQRSAQDIVNRVLGKNTLDPGEVTPFRDEAIARATNSREGVRHKMSRAISTQIKSLGIRLSGT